MLIGARTRVLVAVNYFFVRVSLTARKDLQLISFTSVCVCVRAGGARNRHHEADRPSARARPVRCVREQKVPVPGAGARVRRRAVRLSGEEGPPDAQGGAQILSANHLGAGLLSFALDLVCTLVMIELLLYD